MRTPILKKKEFVGKCNAHLWYGIFKFYFTQQWMYTNTGNHVAHGSLLSDTVITKTQTTVGRRVFALSWLIPGTNCAEN
jgi:hypothetical protein